MLYLESIKLHQFSLILIVEKMYIVIFFSMSTMNIIYIISLHSPQLIKPIVQTSSFNAVL